MAQSIQDVMARSPVAVDGTTKLHDVARSMRDQDIGNVIVLEDGQICGIVTDRDIVTRAIADGRNPTDMSIGEICSRDLTFCARPMTSTTP